MSLRTINGRYGPVTFYGKDEYVGKSLYNYGEFSPEECDYLVSIARGHVLDIGANIGCVAQALLSAGFTVDCFEPNPQIYGLLEKNVSSMGGRCFNHGFSSVARGSVMPRTRPDARNNLGGLSVDMKSELGTVDVVLKTVDSMYLDVPVGLMKIDVEGHEIEVLRGAVETIRKWKPVMYIEDDRVEKSVALRAFVRELGYSISEHCPPLYCEKNFFDKRVCVWDTNYISKNIVCLPLADPT